MFDQAANPNLPVAIFFGIAFVGVIGSLFWHAAFGHVCHNAEDPCDCKVTNCSCLGRGCCGERVASKEEKRRQLISLLQDMNPFTDINMAMMLAVQRNFVLTAIETVFLRERDGEIEVLLARRFQEDPIWPGGWHSPGSMSRLTDESHQDAFDRVTRSEIGVGFKQKPQLVDCFIHKTDRGPETAVVYLCEADNEPKTGQFFNVKALPEGLLSHHPRIINAAVEFFKKDR